ncbi:MAG: hypothetical protein LAT81_03545 [Oceanicaulis sp.]|nr:hypothetical protein [Oceanicaulis sp.]
MASLFFSATFALALILPFNLFVQVDEARAIQVCRTLSPEQVRNPSVPGRIEFSQVRGQSILCVYGSIDALTREEESALNHRRGRILVLRSSGGDVRSWLNLAHTQRASVRRVIVDGLCASSCANYGFVLGDDRYISSHSLVIWHGGPVRDNRVFESLTGSVDASRLRELREDWDRLASSTERLYRDLAISTEILADTAMPAASTRDTSDDRNTPMIGYSIGPEVLRSCYGIAVNPRSWYPQDPLVLELLSRERLGGWVAQLPARLENDPCRTG